MDFAIDNDESEASGSKSSKSEGYVAMQTRIAAKKKEHRELAKAAGKPVKGSNTTKRVKKSSGNQGPAETHNKKGRALSKFNRFCPTAGNRLLARGQGRSNYTLV